MSATSDPIERAIIGAACRVLDRHAQRLRTNAARLTSTTLDGAGREVTIREPEALTMLTTAAFFDECASDLRGRP